MKPFKNNIFYYILMFFWLLIPCALICTTFIGGLFLMAFFSGSSKVKTGAGAIAFIAPFITIFGTVLLDILFLCKIGDKHIKEEYDNSEKKLDSNEKTKEISISRFVFIYSVILIIGELLLSSIISTIFLISLKWVNIIFICFSPFISYYIFKKYIAQL